MFEIKEKQKVLPDGTRITTFTREITGANMLEVEAGTNGFKGGNAEHGSRTYPKLCSFYTRQQAAPKGATVLDTAF